MIALLFIAVAAMLNAIMDLLENENFHKSIFYREKTFGLYWDSFWYKRESWKYAKQLFGYKFDGWHISKSLMIISFAFAIVLYNPIILWWIDIIIMGIIWNVTFNLFYHKIFRSRES